MVVMMMEEMASAGKMALMGEMEMVAVEVTEEMVETVSLRVVTELMEVLKVVKSRLAKRTE